MISTAMGYAKRSLDLGRIHGLKEQIRDANLKLSEYYELTGNTEESFRYYKDYITFRDSVSNVETVQNLANLRTDFEVSQKQIEVDLLNQEKKNQRNVLISLGYHYDTGCHHSGDIILVLYQNSERKKARQNLFF
jgi:adenylate cyclase